MARERVVITQAEIRRIRARLKKTGRKGAKRVTAEILASQERARQGNRLIAEILKQPVNYNPPR